MLIRSKWTLTTDEPVSLPRSYGLELVKLLHSRLGIEMGSEEIPSTSFSGIVGQCRSSKEFLTFEPGDFYRLSLNGLQESSSKAIAELELGDHL
ncbi:MAG: CRISPR-associated protein Cas6, partial [Cyanobacteria bacterium P01_G01_bin.4]